MSDKAKWLEDFNTKGFVFLHEPDLIDLIDVDGFDMKYTKETLRDNNADDLPEHINEQLSMVSQLLKMKYIDEMFDQSEFMKYILWQGVDADSGAWHNDGFEGMNAFFLAYFDDMEEETGGAVQFRWIEDGETIEETIFPKRGNMVLLNQAPGFFHRAEKATIRRRQVSFDFMVE